MFTTWCSFRTVIQTSRTLHTSKFVLTTFWGRLCLFKTLHLSVLERWKIDPGGWLQIRITHSLYNASCRNASNPGDVNGQKCRHQLTYCLESNCRHRSDDWTAICVFHLPSVCINYLPKPDHTHTHTQVSEADALHIHVHDVTIGCIGVRAARDQHLMPVCRPTV